MIIGNMPPCKVGDWVLHTYEDGEQNGPYEVVEVRHTKFSEWSWDEGWCYVILENGCRERYEWNSSHRSEELV
jgi:hypothetical protein